MRIGLSGLKRVRKRNMAWGAPLNRAAVPAHGLRIEARVDFACEYGIKWKHCRRTRRSAIRCMAGCAGGVATILCY